MDENIEKIDEEIEFDRTDISFEVADSIFDITIREYEQCFENKRELDQKAGILLAIIGVIIGFVITKSNELNLILVYSSCILLLISASFCIYELLIRSYKGIDADKTFKKIIDKELLKKPIKLKLSLISELNEYNKWNDDIYKKLVKLIKLATLFFILGIVVLFFSFILS